MTEVGKEESLGKMAWLFGKQLGIIWYYIFFQSWTRKGALHGKQFWEKIQKLWAHTELIPPQEEMYNTGARRASTFSYIIQTLGTLDKSWDINSTICISYFLFGLLKQLVEAKLFSVCWKKKFAKQKVLFAWLLKAARCPHTGKDPVVLLYFYGHLW